MGLRKSQELLDGTTSERCWGMCGRMLFDHSTRQAAVIRVALVTALPANVVCTWKIENVSTWKQMSVESSLADTGISSLRRINA